MRPGSKISIEPVERIRLRINTSLEAIAAYMDNHIIYLEDDPVGDSEERNNGYAFACGQG